MLSLLVLYIDLGGNFWKSVQMVCTYSSVIQTIKGLKICPSSSSLHGKKKVPLRNVNIICLINFISKEFKFFKNITFAQIYLYSEIQLP